MTKLPSNEIPYLFFSEQHSQNKTANEIMDFVRLPRGWHYGRGGPIDKKVCVWALQLNRHAVQLGLQRTEAFPGIDGEILVSVYLRDHTFDFTIYPDGHVTFRHEYNDEDVAVAENLSLDTAKLKLTILRNVIWNLSVSSIRGTSAKKKDTSSTSSSSPAQTMEEYPLSTDNVPWINLKRIVGTL